MPDDDTPAAVDHSPFVQRTSPGRARIDVSDIAGTLETLEGYGRS